MVARVSVEHSERVRFPSSPPVKCAIDSCGNDAVVSCTWGTRTKVNENVNLCEGCKQELWKTLNPLLQLTLAWIIIEEPKHETN